MKIWAFCCFIFSFILIKKLNDERYDVTYVLEDRPAKNKQAVCIPFEQIFEYDQSSPPTTVEWLKFRLLNFFLNESFDREGAPNVPSNFRDIMVARIRMDAFYIHNYHYCLLVNREFSMYLTYQFSNLTLFVFESEPFVFFLHGSSPERSHLFSDLLLIQNHPHPYSNCSDGGSQQENLNRFQCTTACLKANHRSLQLFYSADDTGQVYFSTNYSLQDQKNCLDSCEEDCELKFYFAESDDPFSSNLKKFKSLPTTSNFDFWIQLISIVFLFLNFSFFEKVPLLFERLLNLIARRTHSGEPNSIRHNIHHRINNSIHHNIRLVKIATFIACLISFLGLFVKIKDDFDRRLATPIKRETTTTLLEPEPLSLVICVPVQGILLNNFDRNENNETEKQTEEPLYLNKTLKELEMLTDHGLNQTLRSIYVSIESVKQEVKFVRSSSVLFLFTYTDGLLRCFRIELTIKQMKFQSLLQISKLTLKFWHTSARLHLLSDHQPFTLYTRGLNVYQNIRKMIIKRARNCLDYGQTLNCESRSSCIDRCINAEYAERNSSINFNTFISKDYFSEHQWSSYQFRAVYRDDRKVRERCKNKFKLQDCTEIYFTETTRLDQESRSSVKLNLFYEISTITEQTVSFGKLISDVLNLQFIFGFNMLNILLFLFALLEAKLGLASRRLFRTSIYRLFRVSIYVLCTIGFAVHSYCWLDGALNGEMIDSELYQLLDVKPEFELVFCFKFDHKQLLDSHVRPSGQHLSRLTSDMTVETVFDTIEYLDEENHWIRLNVSSLSWSNEFGQTNSSEMLKTMSDRASSLRSETPKIEEFFFLNKKCFLVRLHKQYSLHQFLYRSGTEVLRVKFDDAFIARKENLTFFTKKPGTMQTGKIVNCFHVQQNLIQSREEQFELEVVHKLSLLKNPLSLFYSERHVNDVNLYIKRVIRTFKERYNRSTIYFPLKESNYQLELDDTMFVQYYKQVQQVEDEQAPKNYNFQREFTITHFDNVPTKERRDFHLRFSLIFYRKKITLTSQYGYPSLILGLLNVLALWLDLGVLDLQEYLFKFRIIFTFGRLQLLSLKAFLLRKLARNLEQNCPSEIIRHSLRSPEVGEC